MKQIDDLVQKASVDKSKRDWRLSLPKPSKASFPRDKSYFVKLSTNKGPIEIRLLADVAPMHVTSFLYLTRLGFYDGLAFHRVITGFMAQGGCPRGTGGGGRVASHGWASWSESAARLPGCHGRCLGIQPGKACAWG